MNVNQTALIVPLDFAAIDGNACFAAISENNGCRMNLYQAKLRYLRWRKRQICREPSVKNGIEVNLFARCIEKLQRDNRFSV